MSVQLQEGAISLAQYTYPMSQQPDYFQPQILARASYPVLDGGGNRGTSCARVVGYVRYLTVSVQLQEGAIT